MTTSAEVLAEAAAPAPADTEEVQVEVEATVVEPTEGEPNDSQENDTDEEETPELPDAVKEILKKNRKSLREAEARAAAAEKALAAKDADPNAVPTDTSDRYKDLYLKSAAKAALVEAGITTGADKFLRMLDLSSVEVDEDGAITGLDTQIEDIKDDFADILTPKKKTPTKVDGAGRREAPVVPKTSAQILAERFNNG